MPQYTVPQEFGGKNLYSLPGFGGRQDVLGQIIGVDPNSPLSAGHSFSLPYGVDPSSTEAQYIQSRFSTAAPGGDALSKAYAGAESTLAAGKPIIETAYTEQGRQLEGEKQPLLNRYQSILDDLLGRETKETGQVATATAREYGKRGIPLSSGVYEQDLLGKTRDISQFYGGQRKEVGFEREDKLRLISNLLAKLPIEKAKDLQAIDEKIAELRISGADKATQQALEMARIEREDKWQQEEAKLAKQEFELKKYVAEQPAQEDRYATLSEGQTLFDLLTRQGVYTAPKTYKPGGDDNGGPDL